MAPKTRAQAKPSLRTSSRISIRPKSTSNPATSGTPSSLKKRPVNAYKSGEDPESIIVFTDDSSRATKPTRPTPGGRCANKHQPSNDATTEQLLGRYNKLCDQLDWIYDRAWKAFEQQDEMTMVVFTSLLQRYTPVET